MPRSRARAGSSACPLLKPLATLEHYHLLIDSVCRLFVARRTPAPFADARAIEICFDRIVREIAKIQRQDHKLLVDTRFGPIRNDLAFEDSFAEQRGKLLLGFSRSAALASTAAGRLQILRHARADGRVIFTTGEPEAAFEHLGTPYHELVPLVAAGEI